MVTLVIFMAVGAALALGFSIGYNASKKEERNRDDWQLSKAATETDTYYAVEWRSKEAPEEGWRLAKDSYVNVKQRDTAEGAREIIQRKKAVLSSFGFSDTPEFRIVKITMVKEVVE